MKRPTHRTPKSSVRTAKREARVLVQTEFPVAREHAGKKSVRRLARLWVKP